MVIGVWLGRVGAAAFSGGVLALALDRGFPLIDCFWRLCLQYLTVLQLGGRHHVTQGVESCHARLTSCHARAKLAHSADRCCTHWWTGLMLRAAVC